MTPVPDVWPVAMVTGHRPQHLDPNSVAWIGAELRRVAAKLHTTHATRTLISGLALGPDMWWGSAAIRNEMDLRAHIPFPQQPDPWRDQRLRAEWQRLVDYAEATGGATMYGDLAGVPQPDRKRAAARLLHARNDGMLTETALASGVVVAVLRLSKLDGGTRSAWDKAEAGGLPIIHVEPDRRTVTMVGKPATVRRDPVKRVRRTSTE